MIAGGGVALAVYIVGCINGSMDAPVYYLGMEPIYSGLIASFVLTMIGIVRRKKSSDDKGRYLRIPAAQGEAR
jgi:hypothetical protein